MATRTVKGPSMPGYEFYRCPVCHIQSCPGCEAEEVEVMADTSLMRETTSSPMCPWCGDEVSDSAEDAFGSDEAGAEFHVDCGKCGHPVIVYRYQTVTFQTKRRKEKETR
jgi:hypothetical protein